MTATSLTQSETRLLDDMVKVMVEVAAPEKIILFGSRAKGTAKGTSDYDFLVVTPEPFGEGYSRRKEIGKLGRALAKFRVPKDILMYSHEEVEQRRHWRNSVVFRALQDGKVLYEQA